MADPRAESAAAIAIVGMAGRFPGASSVDALWENLAAGRESISRLSDAELLASGIRPEMLAQPNYVKARGILEGVDLFDAPLFGFTPREAELTDPQHRLFLETCWTALETAGYDAESYPGPIGVFGGLSMNTYLLTTLARNPEFLKDLAESYQIGSYPTVIGNDYNFLATRVSYKLNLKGPALTVQTGCSTSLVAVCLAARALLHYECDVALAGGVSITFPQKRGYLYQEGAMGSADGHCRAFDAKGQGTVFGSGVAVVVLKRLVDALEEGDTIRAVIRGFALNNDGSSKVGYMAPSVDGQAQVIAMAHAHAGVDAGTIRYVETHGTGTPLGDPIEVAGLTKAFRATTDASGFCAIGSVKPNLGHLDIASGVTGLIKATLALERRQIPPSLHFESPNPEIDFANSPFYVARTLEDWKAGPAPRRAGVSAFGVGGTNAHVVLEEAPTAPGTSPPRPEQILILSARSAEALEAATRHLADHLEKDREVSLADVAYTLQIGRRAFPHRRMLVCKGREDAVRELARKAPERVVTRVTERPGRPVAFLFPGQGSQHVGMGLEVHQTESRFRQELSACREILESALDVSLLDLLYPVRERRPQADERIHETRLAQPLLFAVEYALARLWEEWGVVPEAMLGHSVGEYVAACLAGVFSAEDALRLLAARSRLMQGLPRGAMLAVRLSESEARATLRPGLSLAAVNAPTLCVLSGPSDAVAELAQELDRRKVATRLLKTSHAFHSPMMDPIVEPFLAEVRKVRLSAPRIPYVSGLTGTWITPEEATDPAYWVRHFREPVRFAQGLAQLRDTERVLLEVGPGQTLSTLARAHRAPGGGEVLASLPGEGKPERSFLFETVGRLWASGVDIDWAGFHRRERRRRVPLPTYPFERKSYWIESPAASGKVPVPQPSERPAAALPEGVLAAPTPPPPDVSASNGSGRALSLVQRLLSDLSGLSPEQVEPSLTFLELGFDSLFLTQASQEIQKKLGVRVTFRQLLGDIATPESLARLVAETLPPEAPPLPVEKSPEPVAASPTTAPGGATGSPLERLIGRQLELMQEQLALLRGAPGALAAPQAIAPEAVASALTPHAEKADFKPFGPYKPIEKAAASGLTQGQRQYLDSFIDRYTRRTPESKRLTQAARQRFADPRVVAGFRSDWKEIVYPIVSVRSSGSKLWDVDGNEYVDMLMGYGLNLFGHSPSFVTEAVTEQLRKGVEIGPQSPVAARVAELMCELTGMDRATFCNTGSEAVMAAIRLARTVTARDRIALFTGSYHGTFDEVLVRAGRGAGARRSFPIAPGIPQAKVDNVLVLDYGTEESLRLLEAQMPELAAVLVEPVQSRHPDLQPREFLHEIRRLTERAGTALIFDEVITGFRVAPGGAQAWFDVRADIATYGKVIGGGMPIGAVAGRAAFMDALDGGSWQFGDASVPEAGVTFFAGTFVRHPLAMAAALAVLTHLKERGPSLQQGLNARAARFAEALNDCCRRRGVPLRVQQFSSILFLGIPSDQKLAGLLFYHLREKGVHIWEGFPCFVTTAHSDADLDFVLRAFDRSLQEMQEGELLPAGPVVSREPEPAVAAPAVASLAADPSVFPLTEPQKEVWLAAQMGTDASCAFNESITVRLDGELDVAALSRAFQSLVDRHEALRTTFDPEGEVQRIASSRAADLPLRDLTALSAEEAEETVARLLAEEARAPFDLASGPLFRATLLRVAPREHRLVWTIHHLASDGWSTNVLIDELATIYSAERSGRPSGLPPAPRFGTYAASAGGTAAEEAERYWLEELANAPPALELPVDRPRPPVKGYAGATYRARIPKERARAVQAAGASAGATLFTTLFASFGALLHRLTGQDDLVIGVPAAAQSAEGLEGLVGHCVNFLPVRLSASGNPAWPEYLKDVRRKVLDAYEHQNTTYGSLIRQLTLPRDASRLPLIEVQFNLEKVGAGARFEGLRSEVDPNPKAFVNSDIFVNVVETPEGLTLDCDYNTELFDEETVARWMSHYEVLLEAVAAKTSATVFGLPVWTEPERRRVLVEWNCTARDFPGDATLPHLFEAQAAATPRATAVEWAGERIRYGDLQGRANALASYLERLGARPGVLVGVCLDRTPELIAALLAVMKTGAAYVPLDPQDPPARLAGVLEDAGADLLVTMSATAERLPVEGCRLALLDDDAPEIAQHAGQEPPLRGALGALAYVIYTSGSTGRPKGVEVTHRALANLLFSMQREPGLAAGDALLAVTTVSFDIAALELFLPLTVGGRVVLTSRDEAADGGALRRYLESGGITALQGTPATWKLLLEAGWQGGKRSFKMLCGGETLPRELALDLLARGGELWNMYGPTETTVWSAARRITPQDDPICVGPPIANTQMYVLDRYGHPAPVGTAGELWIGGDGVAAGYHRRPEKTAEAFVPDPFLPGASRRIYRTGDVARFQADGALQLLGRADRQIKLRGFRVELGDVEAALASIPGVREAAAVLAPSPHGEPALVGHVVVDATGPDPSEEGGFATQMREQWEEQYRAAIEETPAGETAPADPSLRIFAWSGVDDVESEVAKWLDHTVARIRELRPRRVLEIGCGTGSLLEKLAPHCESYHGTDISEAALENLRTRLSASGALASRVSLERRDAADFRGIAPGAYDTVILNSVVEYLPGVDYLVRVLEGAVRAVAPGGSVFLGDVPSLPLLEAFHASVQLAQAPGELPADRWRDRVQGSPAQATRLVVDPDLFRVLRHQLPRVTQVEIQLQRGDYDSEISRFHADLYFDAVLHVECEETPALERVSRNWEKDRLTVTEVRRLLIEEGPEVLIVAGVPARRLLRAARVVELMEGSEKGSADALRAELDAVPGVELEDLWELASDLPYAVEATWSGSGRDGRCDILYQRRAPGAGKRVSPGFVREAPRMGPWSAYANDPARSMAVRMRVRAIRQQLQERLPAHMVPAVLAVVDALPRTPAGKVDYRELSRRDPWIQGAGRSFLPPRTHAEKTLLGIVAEVLHRDDVGILDNVFEMGADSLLIFQISSRAARAGLSVSPRAIFQHPTVMKLAESLTGAGARDVRPDQPPIVPVSRGTHKVSRASL